MGRSSAILAPRQLNRNWRSCVPRSIKVTISMALGSCYVDGWTMATILGASLLLGQEDATGGQAPVPQQPQDAPPSQTPAAPGGQDHQQQQGEEVSTAAAKLVAEVVASPVFYLVAGGLGWWCHAGKDLQYLLYNLHPRVNLRQAASCPPINPLRPAPVCFVTQPPVPSVVSPHPLIVQKPNRPADHQAGVQHRGAGLWNPAGSSSPSHAADSPQQEQPRAAGAGQAQRKAAAAAGRGRHTQGAACRCVHCCRALQV